MHRLVFCACFLVLAATAYSCGSQSRPPYFYALRYDLTNYPRSLGAFLDQFEVKTLKKTSSKRVNNAINDMTQLADGELLFSYHREPEFFYKKIEFYDPFSLLKRSKKIIETQGLGPRGVIPIGGKYYVQLEAVRKLDADIAKEPNKVPYDGGGFEVYSANPVRQIATIRLGRTARIRGVSVDAKNAKLYVAVCPMMVEDKDWPEFGSVRENYEGLSYIYVIDCIQDKIVRTIDLSSYLKDVSGIGWVNNELYVSAYSKKELDGGIDAEFYRREKYKREGRISQYLEKRDFESFANDMMYVFSLPSFAFQTTIKAKPGLQDFVAAPKSNRLFCKSSAPLGDFNNSLIVIDTESKKMKAEIPIKALNMLSYIGDEKLAVSSREKLIVLNTKRLEIEAIFEGYYAPISVRY
jgi:hypothetical protein